MSRVTYELDEIQMRVFERFKAAVEAEDVDAVRRLMQDAQQDVLKNLLYNKFFVAIRNGDLKMVNVMLRAGLDRAYINSHSENFFGPLNEAISVKNKEMRMKMVKLLVEHRVGLKMDSPNPCLYQQWCVHEAIRQSDCELVQYLVENAGGQLDYCHRLYNNYGGLARLAPIHLAVMELKKNVCIRMIKLLIELGADVNIGTRGIPFGHTCLSLVLRRKSDRCEITRLLLNAGAQLNPEIDPALPEYATYVFPLTSAAYCGDCELMKLMIDEGANVNTPHWTFSALYWAVQRRNVDAVQLLLDHGADVDAKGDDGDNMLCVATVNRTRVPGDKPETRKYMAVLRMLLPRCTDKNPMENEAYVPFKHVLTDGTLDAVLLFLENGVQLNNCGVKFPLHLIMWNRNDCAPKMLELFLKSRLFDVNEVNDEGDTPLAVCLRFTNLDCLKLLVEWGADTSNDSKMTVDELGLSVLDPKVVSCVYLFNESTDILLSAGATIDLNRLKNRLKENHSYHGEQSSPVIKYFIKHMILLQSQGHHIDGDIENLLMGAIPNSSEIVSQCSAELEILKTLVFYGDLTFYDVLIGKDISRYTSNSHVMKNFESLKVIERYPLYGNLIDCRHSLACVRWQVIQEAIKNLNKLFLSYFCEGILYKIISKLQMKDLRNLCDIYH